MSVNVDLIRRVMAQIREHPETWNQASWVNRDQCGTTYCMAGWVVTLTHGLSWWVGRDEEEAYEEAMTLLGIGIAQADELFSGIAGQRNPREFQSLVTKVTGVTFDQPEGVPE